MSQEGDDDIFDESLKPGTSTCSCKRRCNSVIDSIGSDDAGSFLPPGHRTPQRVQSITVAEISPDQGYATTPDIEKTSTIQRIFKERSHDRLDAHMHTVVVEEEYTNSLYSITSSARMPVFKETEYYNMNHKNRGRCVIFNHDKFETGFEDREGSVLDAKRIEGTFRNLGFMVETMNNLQHSDVLSKITELSEEDHTDNDCICIFVLTHGLNNDMIFAKDVAYKSDSIWKPFTADRCKSLAGKPKLFFFQACRGTKFDGGIVLRRSTTRTETDSATASYKIPTHADFLIAHSAVDGFYSWRNPEEGTWYIQCLCDVLDENSQTMDLLRMLTTTARKVATDFASYHDLNPTRHDQKQVPSVTSMLIRDLYFTPK